MDVAQIRSDLDSMWFVLFALTCSQIWVTYEQKMWEWPWDNNEIKYITIWDRFHIWLLRLQVGKKFHHIYFFNMFILVDSMFVKNIRRRLIRLKYLVLLNCKDCIRKPDWRFSIWPFENKYNQLYVLTKWRF